MVEKKENLLLKKAAMILVSLRDSSKKWFLSNLAKANNATFVYTSKIIDKLSRMGLVKSEKKGKVKEVTLTEDGQKIADALSLVVDKNKETVTSKDINQQSQTIQPNQETQGTNQKQKNEKKEETTQP
ncbi:MAG: DUF6293 family protein [Candidatus Micrarchaeales archaeon]